MKNTTRKAILVLFFTFTIGFVAGTLTTGRFVKHRIHHLFDKNHHPPAIQHWIHLIQPTETQKQMMGHTIEKYVQVYRDRREQNHQKSLTLQQQMLKELDLHLTETQKKAIARKLRLIQQKEQNRKANHHPPPPRH